MYGAIDGHVDVIELLLEAGANIEAQNDVSRTNRN
jgi:ankyrin repeat protein